MKFPNITWSVILIAIPAISMFVTGLGQEHLITTVTVDAILGALAILGKLIQERNVRPNPSELPISRSLPANQQVVPSQDIGLGFCFTKNSFYHKTAIL